MSSRSLGEIVTDPMPLRTFANIDSALRFFYRRQQRGLSVSSISMAPKEWTGSPNHETKERKSRAYTAVAYCLRERIEDDAGRLRPEDVEALRLLCLQGATSAATELGISEQSLSKQIGRALDVLAPRLERRGLPAAQRDDDVTTEEAPSARRDEAPPKERKLKTKETADLVGATPKTVRAWHRERRIEAISGGGEDGIYRFREGQFARFSHSDISVADAMLLFNRTKTAVINMIRKRGELEANRIGRSYRLRIGPVLVWLMRERRRGALPEIGRDFLLEGLRQVALERITAYAAARGWTAAESTKRAMEQLLEAKLPSKAHAALLECFMESEDRPVEVDVLP